MIHVLATAFALRLAINLAIWIPLSILFFNILPRYIRWLRNPFPLPLGFAVFCVVFGALLHTLITMFLKAENAYGDQHAIGWIVDV